MSVSAQPEAASRRAGAAIVLQGGGARTAYQAGVLAGVADILQRAGWAGTRNPFPVICGTSAGAMNATYYACGAQDWRSALEDLPAVWLTLRAQDVFDTRATGLARAGLRWMALMASGWLVRQRPRSLLDNAPLARTLQRHLVLTRIDDAVRDGHLRALAITASSYNSGRHLTFFQGVPGLRPWRRPRICGFAQPIGYAHLLASSALPFVFPAVRLPVDGGAEFCGDGAMRQLAPLAPAIHLGARCALAIGVGEPHGEAAWMAPDGADYPSIAQIAGHVLSTVFFDTLAADVQLAQHINAGIRNLPPAARAGHPLREFPVLLITPSASINELAARHWQRMPGSIRRLLGALGASEQAGAALASYLLFEPTFARALVDLGLRDAHARADHIARFVDAELSQD